MHIKHRSSTGRGRSRERDYAQSIQISHGSSQVKGRAGERDCAQSMQSTDVSSKSKGRAGERDYAESTQNTSSKGKGRAGERDYAQSMQSTSNHRSSRGKARAAEGDYAQSFASLSLSDYGDHHAPRSNSYELPYRGLDVYGSSYEQPYSGDTQYGWMAQSSQSSSAASGSTPGYSGAYPITSTKLSTGGSEDRSEPSTSSPSGNAEHDTASVTSGCVPSSYGGGSGSGWSDVNRTAVPSTHSTYGNRTDVNDCINRQQPPNDRYPLPCEFHNLTGCDTVFTGDDEQGWIKHVEEHLKSKFPTRLRCWFCTDQRFDARETSGGDVRSNFITRMGHIRDHIVYDGFRRGQARKDDYLVQHLLDHELIDRRTDESITNPTVPPMRASRRGHRRLPQVEEEVVAKPSSIAHVGDETATDTVVNALHGLNVGHAGEASRDSPGRVQSPQSEDRANVGLSSYSTDASTPESGSSWLAGYSEDEGNKQDEDHPFNQCRPLAVARVFNAFHSWRESYSDRDTPCDGVEEVNHTPYKDRGKGKGEDSGTGKRKRADQSETNNSKDNSNRPSSKPTPNEDEGNGTDSGIRADQSEPRNGKDNSNGPSSSRSGCGKRRRMSDRQLTFACPYTKKDPMSYRDCYRYKLSRIRDVKQHLVRCHRNPPYCARCMDTFETEEERDVHARQKSLCPLRTSKLDGITESQRSQLAKKSTSNTPPEAQWFAVFDIVFPGHKPRPQSPYVDSELLQDIRLYQDFSASHGPRILAEVLIQRGAVTWNCPDDEHDLAAFQQEVLGEGLRKVFDQWLARRSSSSQTPSVTSSSGGTAQNTPPSSSNSGERVDSTSAHNPRAGLPESSGSRSGAGPADAHLYTEHVHGASADQDPLPLGEVLDGSFNLEQGNSDFLSELIYDGSDDELTRLFTGG